MTRLEAYDVLGLSYEVTEEEIKKAYKNLAKKYHPDNFSNSNNDKIKEINEAYSILMNSKKFESSSEFSDDNSADFVNFYGFCNRKTQTSHTQEEMDDIEWTKDVWEESVFQRYHIKDSDNPDSFLYFVNSKGKKEPIIAYWKNQKGELAQKVIYKLFYVWDGSESFEKSYWKKAKLEKYLLKSEKKRLEIYSELSKSSLSEGFLYSKKYVEIYLKGIEMLEKKYYSDDYEFFMQLSKWRKDCLTLMIEDYKKVVLQPDVYGYEELKGIVEEGINTCNIYFENEKCASTIADSRKKGNTLMENIKYENPEYEDFSDWRDSIGLYTSFDLQIWLFYHNVLYKVYSYYKDTMNKQKKDSLDFFKNNMMDKLLEKIWSTEKLCITEDEAEILDLISICNVDSSLDKKIK